MVSCNIKWIAGFVRAMVDAGELGGSTVAEVQSDGVEDRSANVLANEKRSVDDGDKLAYVVEAA